MLSRTGNARVFKKYFEAMLHIRFQRKDLRVVCSMAFLFRGIMEYSFNVSHAMKYGVEESIVLKNLIFWIIKNKANNKNINDGRTWTYNSVTAFKLLFPFWSSRQINRILKSLIKQGVIITGNYNKVAYDRTLWYAIKDESILLNGEMESTEWSNQIDQNGKPIPDINTDRKQINKTADKSAYRLSPDVVKIRDVSRINIDNYVSANNYEKIHWSKKEIKNLELLSKRVLNTELTVKESLVKLKIVFDKYIRLKESTNKFWSDQPFTPAVINSMYDRIMAVQDETIR